MKVSVVVPAYNQAAYLREALASALGQTHRELEVIVVDDGSTDVTREVCDSFGDSRLRYIHQRNDGTKGLGARNRAMLEARGDWIALLDQDDRWAPEKLAKQLLHAAAHPAAGAVFCRVRFINETGKETGTQRTELPEGDVFHEMLRRNHYYAASGMFRRSLLQLIGLPHAWVGLGDHALWLTISRCAPVAVVDELLADYRVHGQSYQEAKNRAGVRHHDHDGWQLTMFEKALMHPGCAACRQAHAHSRRGAAKSYLRSVQARWHGGFFVGSGLALWRGVSLAPRWFALPWIVVPQSLRLAWAALRGVLLPVK